MTRERLYFDALEGVYSNTSKVMVDVEGGNNMLYLPLDQLTKRSSAGSVEIDQTLMDNAVERILREVNAQRSDNSRARVRSRHVSHAVATRRYTWASRWGRLGVEDVYNHWTW